MRACLLPLNLLVWLNFLLLERYPSSRNFSCTQGRKDDALYSGNDRWWGLSYRLTLSAHERAMGPSLRVVQAAAAICRRSEVPEQDWQHAVCLTHMWHDYTWICSPHLCLSHQTHSTSSGSIDMCCTCSMSWESELWNYDSNILLLFVLAFLNMELIVMAWSAWGWGMLLKHQHCI